MAAAGLRSRGPVSDRTTPRPSGLLRPFLPAPAALRPRAGPAATPPSLPIPPSAPGAFRVSVPAAPRAARRVLREKFPRASAIRVVDISGGCGAMYEIHIESEEFREKRTVQQHQMVNQALSEEIKSMHGLRIFTSVPKS
uniref:BolA-like protein 3 n=1 Tax=Phasianus colchicus TaxID=9054 RepID=A0A669Q0R6_PHACC